MNKVKRVVIEGRDYYVVLIPVGYDGGYRVLENKLYNNKEEAEAVVKLLK